MRAWRKRTAVLLVLILAVAAADSMASLTDSAVHTPPNFYTFTPPAAGQSYVDPTFGERITRVTDARNMTNPGPFGFITAEYASTTLTNANDTYVRLTGGSSSRLFALPSLSYVRSVPMSSSSPSDFWWHVTDPNLLYGVPGNRLEVYNVATDQKTVLRTFSQFGIISGMGESSLSHDGDRLALRGKNPVGGGSDYLLIYEFSSNSVVASIPISAMPSFFDATITPSGERLIAHIIPPGQGGQVLVYDINDAAGTITLAYALPKGAGHNDTSFGPDGKEYLVIIDSWFTNTLYRYDLEDGTRTTLIPFGWTGASTVALHVSTNSMASDGWIYLSTYIGNGSDPNPSQQWSPYQGELLRVKWDGSMIERLGHNRTKKLAYWNQPRASISASGRYLFWSSNYRRNHDPSAPNDYSDVYMMDFGPPNGASGLLLDGLGGLHNSGYTTVPLAPRTPYFFWDAGVDVELGPTGYYVLDSLGGLYAGGGAPAISPPTPYFAFVIAKDLELLPGGGAYVLDGFGGVNPGGGASLSQGSIYFGWDIARDLELAPNGFYVLDGFGGVHPGNGAPAVAVPSPYFGFDVAVDLEMYPSGGFYVLDKLGGIHRGGGAPVLTSPVFWGYDFARDLELASPGFYVLDAHGNIHAGGGAPPMVIGSHFFGWDIARDFELR